MKSAWFERAIFLSWYCSKGDCKFCFMSTQKPLIRDPKKSIRRPESILAEALISKLCGWKIEFLSGGYESYALKELVKITEQVYRVTGQKQWLNMGTLGRKEMQQFAPYIEGVCGAVECINRTIRKEVCPSKPVEPIIRMLKEAGELGLKKSITIIIGIGETEKDIPLLINFIRKYHVDKITFYALNPHKGTQFTKGPETEYYIKWIKAVRGEFPNMQVVAGSWVDRLSEIHILLDAGADAITKFKAMKLFGSKYARQFESEIARSGRRFEGTMTRLPKGLEDEIKKLEVDDALKQKIRGKAEEYLNLMARHQSFIPKCINRLKL